MTSLILFLIVTMEYFFVLFSSNKEIMERLLAMQRIQRQNDILQQFHMKLRADTDPEPVTNYLYQAKIIDEYALEEILSMQTRRNKNKALLIKLRKVEDPNAFSEFVNGLEKEQPHLACILLKEG